MSRLEFKTIRLKDYRQYGGEQEIELMSTDGRINIIEGQNGAGKSNLLNAVTLCFYGEEKHMETSGEEMESLPLVTRGQLEKVPDGEAHTGYVEVELGTEEPEYVFRREFETYRVGDEFNNEVGDLTLQRKIGHNWKQPNNPETHLNQVLPSTVSDYFLFDGEALDSFFEEGYTTRVRSAILDVSHIQLLNGSLDHLQKVQTDIERTAGNLEGKAGEYREEKDELESKLADKKDELAKTKQNIEDTKAEIDRIERKLRDYSDEIVQDLYERRETLISEVDNLQTDVETLRTETVELMVDAGPVAYSAEALDSTLDLFDDLANKGQIPPKIQDWFIDELIDRGQCICGTELTEGGSHAQHLRSLQEDVSEVMEENLEGKSEIPSMMEIAAEKVRQIRSNRSEIAQKRDSIEDKKEEVQNIRYRLKSYDTPDEDEIDLESLESQREELTSRLEELQKRQGRLDTQIENLEEEIETAKSNLRRELEKESRYEEVVTQLEFAETAEDYLRDIKESILAEIRENTEANLEEYFNEIIWKNQDYDIILNDDYSIEVLGDDNDNTIGSLSAGEQQVLALSFMAALTQISGFNAPILIDTPLGRISSEPRKKIAQNLPRYVENTQITFLMTDEEYTQSVRGILKGTLANEYQLHHKDTITTVRPYA
jgi:DNA sulfur modification protein DndD